MRIARFYIAALSSLVVLLASCGGGDGVSSEREARAAYLGVDGAIAKALALGMDGFNAATSANIPAQLGEGDVSGTLTVAGQVDAGASANKEMRLTLALVDYQDGVEEGELEILYDTMDPLPALDLSLRGIPDGTFTGTLMGDFHMTGDVAGPVTLELMFAGELEAAAGSDAVQRVEGTTRITGTATSSAGVFDVDLTI